MDTWKITGNITDDQGNPLADRGLEVSINDQRFVNHEAKGKKIVGSSYSFEFDSSWTEKWFGRRPNLIVTLWAQGRRPIAQRPLGELAPGTYQANFKVHPLHLSGWLVTLPLTDASKDPDGNPVHANTSWKTDKNNDLIPFVDNQEAWAAANNLARTANSEVAFSQLNFKIFAKEVGTGSSQRRSLIMEFTGTSSDVRGTHLGDVMAESITCPVRILLNKHELDSDFDDVRKFFLAKNVTERVLLRSFNALGTTSFMHAKNLIVDKKTVLLLGSPLDQAYYNDHFHRYKDYQRGLSGDRPRHDVSVQVTGETAAALYNGFFRAHWNSLSQAGTLPPAEPIAGSGNHTVQVVRSLCGEKILDCPKGETGIFEAYQRAIASAQKYIYLENQFITCPEIIDSLSLALDARPNLELIMLVNIEYTRPELHYSSYQNAAIARLFSNMEKLKNKDAWKRIGMFVKWTHEVLPDGLPVLINNYVHSKVGIVDDNWAIVGSANLDGVSLLKKEFVRFDARNNPKDYSEVEEAGKERSSEICVSVPDSVFAKSLRTALFKHHLGPDLEEDASSWLTEWHDTALDKLLQLKKTPNAPTACTVLPWPRDPQGRPLNIANNNYWYRAFPAAVAFLNAYKIGSSGISVGSRRGDWVEL